MAEKDIHHSEILPPDPGAASYYDRLGVRPGDDAKTIRDAYFRAARMYHPQNNPQGTDDFIRVAEAYKVLSDSEEREEYDLRLSAKEWEVKRQAEGGLRPGKPGYERFARAMEEWLMGQNLTVDPPPAPEPGRVELMRQEGAAHVARQYGAEAARIVFDPVAREEVRRVLDTLVFASAGVSVGEARDEILKAIDQSGKFAVARFLHTLPTYGPETYWENMFERLKEARMAIRGRFPSSGIGEDEVFRASFVEAWQEVAREDRRLTEADYLRNWFIPLNPADTITPHQERIVEVRQLGGEEGRRMGRLVYDPAEIKRTESDLTLLASVWKKTQGLAGAVVSQESRISQLEFMLLGQPGDGSIASALPVSEMEIRAYMWWEYGKQATFGEIEEEWKRIKRRLQDVRMARRFQQEPPPEREYSVPVGTKLASGELRESEVMWYRDGFVEGWQAVENHHQKNFRSR